MNTYNKYFSTFENSFFACITVGVLVNSIIGSIAAMAVITHGNSFSQMIQLFLVVGSCMTYNGSILSQQKPKTIFNVLICSICICVFIATLNFIR